MLFHRGNQPEYYNYDNIGPPPNITIDELLTVVTSSSIVSKDNELLSDIPEAAHPPAFSSGLLVIAVSSILNRNDSLDNASDVEELLDKRSLSEKVTMTILYSAIFITGVVGNVCTCIVIALNRYMHTATNYYLFSLSISDLLLLLLGLPYDTLLLWSPQQQLSWTFCMSRGFLSETATDASILTITAFTIERYVAICHPLRAHRMSTLGRAIRIILVVWIVSALCAYVIVSQYGLNERGECTAVNPLANLFIVSTAVFFVLPLTVIVALYILIGLQLRHSASVGTQDNVSPETRHLNHQCHQNEKYRWEDEKSVKFTPNNNSSFCCCCCKTPRHSGGGSKKAVIKMLVAVVISFFVCWTPFHVQRVWAQSLSSQFDINNAQHFNKQLLAVYVILNHVSGISYYLSATANPILYQILSLKFRQAMRDTFSRCCSRYGHRSGFLGYRMEDPQFSTSLYRHRRDGSDFISRTTSSTKGSTTSTNNEHNYIQKTYTGNSYPPDHRENGLQVGGDGPSSSKFSVRNNHAEPTKLLLDGVDDITSHKSLTDANGLLLDIERSPAEDRISEISVNSEKKKRKRKKATPTTINKRSGLLDIRESMKSCRTKRTCKDVIVFTNNKTNCTQLQVIISTETN